VRAAELCKCDLLTGMVGEFPDLQGTMGRYYAISDGESDVVAEAIGEHYQPRFAGDALPATEEGRVLAMADKLDTLAGIFTIGKKPSGNRDPFGLRRSALGVIRLSIECGLDLDLKALIEHALELQPAGKEGVQELAESLYTFISDRLRRYFLDRDPGLDTETFDAVMARQPSSLVDFELRLQAVQAFLQLDESQSLASANKRIANILRQAEATETSDIDEGLLEAGAERALYDALVAAEATVRPLLDERNYTNALRELAALRGPVDRFFDDVMVMADEATVRSNRLALLAGLRALFLDVADISRLSVA
jgi:glycyl-tRNA synthetase beta chain